jgi:hypothetical protein
MKTKLALVAAVAGVYAGVTGLVCSQEALANASVNQTVNTSVHYDTALSVTTNVAAINYGTVQAGVAGNPTYTVSTAGVLSTVGGTILYGTPAAASFNVIGSATDTVVLAVVSYSAASSGTTASAATCNYNGGAVASCAGTLAAPGAGKILLVGATVTSDGSATAGTTATPSFILSFTYT